MSERVSDDTRNMIMDMVLNGSRKKETGVCENVVSSKKKGMVKKPDDKYTPTPESWSQLIEQTIEDREQIEEEEESIVNERRDRIIEKCDLDIIKHLNFF